MDLLAVFSPLLKMLWWLIPFLIFVQVLRSAWFKGWIGETLVKWVLHSQLPKDFYTTLHNITLTTPDGTTQIDHVVLSPFGIFVIETKHLQGWIFGGEKDAKWTQKIFKHVSTFQNPLRQNYKHTQTIEALLGLDPTTVHSLVVFTGNGKFKKAMPDNVVYVSGCTPFIKGFQQNVFSRAEINTFIQTLQEGRLAPSISTHRQHVKNLKARHSIDNNNCPKCGSDFIKRRATRGQNAGNEFLGCSNYPRCKHTQTI